MFIIERIVGDYRRKTDEWKADRDRWVNESSYRYPREYERARPKPYSSCITTLKAVLGAVIAIHVILLVVWLGVVLHNHVQQQHRNHTHKQTQAITYKDGMKCADYHIGDTGVINYGDYEGADVKIVGGCGPHEDYQVITTKDQTLFGVGSKHPDEDDVYIKAGLTFGVNSSDNITVTGHE